MPTDLSRQLREGTRESHRDAESSPFIRAFLRGSIERSAYVAMLSQLARVYEVLEHALEQHTSHAVLGPLCRPELWRRAALREDLTFFGGDSGQASRAVDAYVTRLCEVREGQPELLVAHAYTRYLGDLAGGQVLRRMAARTLGLTDEGLRFYDFPAIVDLTAYRASYRAQLDALPLTEAQVQAIVEEARRAFALNQALFDELARAE